jgi:hypothetical protein
MNTIRLRRALCAASVLASVAVAVPASASDSVKLTINGRTYQVDPTRPMSIDAAGQPVYTDERAPKPMDAAQAAAAPTTQPTTAPVVTLAAPAAPTVRAAPMAVTAPGAATQAVAAPQAASDDLPPDGAAAGLALPGKLADGSWSTPSRKLTGDAAVWHLRSALNVAALACRGADEARYADGYNGMIRTRAARLAAAEKGLAGEFQAGTAAGREAYDRAMTGLYNYYARPEVHAGFCKAALTAIDAQAKTAEADFDGFCARTLTDLDVPFTGFFDRYAAWTARHPGKPAMMVAAAAPAPVQIAAIR